MQTLKEAAAQTTVVVGETEPAKQEAKSAEVGTQEPVPEGTGLHKVTPNTMKSLKTSADQTSKHFVDCGSHWKAGRLARGSVNCLRIFREVTLILPRACVAFGNDLAEHGFNILDTIADRFDGHEAAKDGHDAAKDAAAVAKDDLPATKRKPRWLAICFMVVVLLYCFNGLKGLMGGDANVASSSSKHNIADDKTEKAIASAIETAIVSEVEDAAANESASQQDKDVRSEASQVVAKSGKSKIDEKKMKKAVQNFVKEILDSK